MEWMGSRRIPPRRRRTRHERSSHVVHYFRRNAAVVATAQHHGMKVTPLRATAGIKNALRAGYDHWTCAFIDDEALTFCLARIRRSFPRVFESSASIADPIRIIARSSTDIRRPSTGHRELRRILRAGGRLEWEAITDSLNPHGDYAAS